MELKLSKDETIEIFKKAFNGVNSVVINKDGEAVLDVELSKFSPIATQTGTIATNVNSMTVPVSEQERKLVTIKPAITTAEQKRLLEQAEKLNQAQNDREKYIKMAKQGEERVLQHF